MHPTYRGLAFLLSLGSLPIACNKDDNETDGTGGTGSTGTDAVTPTTTSLGESTTGGASETSNDATTTTPGTTPGTTPTTDPTTGALDTGDTEPAVTTFLTSNTDTGTGDTGDTDEPPPLPEPTDPTCLAYAAHITECMPGYAGYRTYVAQYCELYKNYGLRLDGQACLDAFEAYYVCSSMVDCAELGEGCATQMMAAEVACPNVFDEGSTTTGIESESEGSDGTGDTNSTG